MYESYDVPEEVIGRGAKTSILLLLEQWELLVADFWSEYHTRLMRDPCTYKEFKTGLIGLLSCDSRIRRWLDTQEDEEDSEGVTARVI